jgi:hypothetical protein
LLRRLFRTDDKRLSVTAAIFAFVFAICLPVDYQDRYLDRISLTATGNKSPNGKSAEVWVRLSKPEWLSVTRYLVEPVEGWEKRDHAFVSYRNQPATLSYSLVGTKDTALQLARNPYSGQVVVEINGQASVYDLYSETGDELRIPLSEYARGQKTIVPLFLRFLTVFGLAGAAFWVLASTLVMRHKAKIPRTSLEKQPSRVLLFSIPSMIAYFLAHLVFWPGQMSPDSIDVWYQLENHAISDGHSAVLNLLYLGLYLIYGHPALPIAAQYIALSFAWGALLAELERWGGARPVLWIFAVGFPCLPASHLIATTLWKDVPYAAALLTLLFLTLLGLRKKWQLSKSVWFSFLAASFLVATLRHNGVLVAIPFLLVLSFVTPKGSPRTTLRLHAVVLLGLLLVLKLAIFPIFAIAPLPDRYKAIQAVHLLGAMVSHGVPLTKDERKEIFDVLAEEDWKRNYDCATVVPLFWHDRLMQYPLGDRYGNLNSVTISLALRNPLVVLEHQLCVTSLLWRITPRPTDNIAISPMEISQMPTAEARHLMTDSLVPKAREQLVEIYEKHVFNNPILGRPAVFFLIGLFCTFLLGMYDGRRLWILYVPAAANTISLALLMNSQDYRYQFPVVASAVLMLCVALSLGVGPRRQLTLEAERHGRTSRS